MSENWFKVCLHAHTTESDGDEPLDSVIDWYRRLGFDCLVVTDHNLVTLPGGEPPQGLLLIGGEEVTVMLKGESVAVYVNGVGLRESVEPVVEDGVLATLQANVDAVVEAGGIACLTSPYYRERFDHHSLVEVEGAALMDIYNAHPNNVLGDPRTFSYERLWDEALTAGRQVVRRRHGRRPQLPRVQRRQLQPRPGLGHGEVSGVDGGGGAGIAPHRRLLRLHGGEADEAGESARLGVARHRVKGAAVLPHDLPGQGRKGAQ